jgi:hypothetical protein
MPLQRTSSAKRKLLTAIATAALVAVAFAYGQWSVASESLRFDLRIIGESIYEAHARSGKWPARIDDLEGTAYLKMPYRKMELEQGVFVIVWHQDLDPDPKANGDKILAYHDRGILSRLGRAWACRGDLRTEYVDSDELRALARVR